MTALTAILPGRANDVTCLGDPLSCPFRSRIGRDVDVEWAPPMVDDVLSDTGLGARDADPGEFADDPSGTPERIG